MNDIINGCIQYTEMVANMETHVFNLLREELPTEDPLRLKHIAARCVNTTLQGLGK